MITIFTPAYNRKDEIIKLYESLTKQKKVKFEWVIVDDGSTDGTDSVIDGFKNEGLIQIVYYKQENAGKNQAHNKGVTLAKGEFFCCMDSDDWFTTDALEVIEKYIDIIRENNDFCGLAFNSYKNDTKEIIGKAFPENNFTSSYYDLYNKYGVTGDKQFVFKTDILKENLVDTVDGEKFIPEAVLLNRLSKKYKFYCINESIVHKRYLENGYSSNYFEIAKKNPKGNMLYYKELYYFDKSLYNVAAYNMYCMFAKIGFINTIKGHPSKLKSLIMYVPAYIKYKKKGGTQ